MFLILVLGLFWFIREIKAFLFWLYLWQLKEYHIGRVIDHFRTYKGKKLLLNKVIILKVVILLVWIAMGYISADPGFFDTVLDFILVSSMVALFVVYFFEGIKAIMDYASAKLLKPVFTRKIQFLIFIFFGLITGFLLFMILSFRRPLVGLLVFDILTPLMVSFGVLFFQPLTVLIRNQIIKKAKRKRESFKDLIVIGITGSYGKTSVKEFLATILEEKYRVLKTKGHQNSEIGISQCILNDLNSEHEVFIVEMGAYGRGGIKLLCDIAKPKIGVLTGINEQHMALFGSLDNITKTKFELIESLPSDGLAVLNADNEIVRNLEPEIDRLIFCSTEEELGFWVKNIVVEKESVHFRAFSKDGDSAQFNLNLLGRESIENVLLISAVAKELGMSLEEIAKACENIEQTDPKVLEGSGGINIIDSSYSANPNGVFFHLNHLKLWSGKKVVIMPCLIELGSSSQEIHQEIGKKIAETCDLGIIVTKDRFEDIKKTAGDKVIFLENPKMVFEKIKPFLNSENVVLLEGRISKEIKNLIYGN